MPLLKKIAYQICLLILILGISACQQNTQKVDLIITNASIWTGNKKQPMAQAIAIAKDSIIAIGTVAEIERFKAEAVEVINMKGKFITPGFIDSHVHLLMGGNALLSVELRDANNPKEFIKRIENHVKTLRTGDWILEGNWDHTLWGGRTS